MPDSLSAYLAILLMAAVTLLTRALGPLIMARVAVSKRVEHFLEALSSSVLAAIVATALFQGGPREATAVAIAGAVMLLTRKSIAAMGAGMAAAALWSLFID
ncbi:AzlD family protein [Sneathiella chinensis]|uniref:Branched-chain amino acid transporter n=1 Tax=Sneathiella chinensis TaxID=349750 RepID=A0ABQ5U8P3_9PROT|nr:AzlD domain-containing protein [Sneathiella chinensis]GLQ07563.1 hypothetical protein GCM10007924_27840 [Sneathiella chinensis]